MRVVEGGRGEREGKKEGGGGEREGGGLVVKIDIGYSYTGLECIQVLHK